MTDISTAPSTHRSDPFATARLAADGSSARAVVDGDVVATYADLDRAADRVANGLLAAGLGGADRVAFLGRNGLPCIELLLGAARAGVVLTILNWRLHPRELSYVLADSGARFVVVTEEFAEVVAGLPDRDSIERVVTVPEGWDAWLDAQPETRPVSATPVEDVAVQLYTSGTTGNPKGAMLTNAGLAATIPDTADLWELDATSVVLSVLPMFHIAGVGTALGTLWAGATLVIENDANPAAMLAAIERHRVTNVVLASVMLQGLVASPTSTTTDLSSLRTVSYGAAPITASVLHEAIATLGCRLMQPYGLTETTGILTVLDADDHVFDPGDDQAVVRLRSCGRPRPGVEIRVVDIHTGEQLLAGGVGEVQASTPRLMRGYWNLPEATAEVLLPDGWFRTGDIGELDSDGYLFLRDRLKDTIVSGGENIYPAEVEDALQWHPEVAEVAVIGIPDDRWGETPRAVVVRTPGATLDAASLLAFARDRLAGYKCPTSVDFVDALPRNPTGKVLRRELREPHWAGRARAIN